MDKFKSINQITLKEMSQYIVHKCIEDKHYISPIRLQQILICIMYEYRKRSQIIFKEEKVNWIPIIPRYDSIYYEYGMYGVMPIFFQIAPCELNIVPNDKAIVDGIIKSKRGLADWDMADEIRKISKKVKVCKAHRCVVYRYIKGEFHYG